MVVGDKDELKTVANSRGLEHTLQAAGGDVKLSIYSGVGHNSWAQTYSTPELYEWLLRHTVSDRIATGP